MLIFIFDDLYIFPIEVQKMENSDDKIIEKTMKRILQIQVAFALVHWYGMAIIMFLVFLGLFFAKYPEIFFRFDPIISQGVARIGKTIDSGLQKLLKTSSKAVIQTEINRKEEIEQKDVDRPVSCSDIHSSVPGGTENNRRNSSSNSVIYSGNAESDIKPVTGSMS